MESSFLPPDLVALGPVVFAIVAFVRRLTAKSDGSYRVEGIVAVSILSLLVSVAVTYWAFPGSTAVDLIRRVPALFLIAVGGTQGLKRILGNEDVPPLTQGQIVTPPTPPLDTDPTPTIEGDPS